MNAKVLIAGVAVAAMVCGAASARTHAMHRHASGAMSYAAPSQPIPYGQLDAYLKASPKQRTAMMSGGAMATAGAMAETPATPMPAASSQPAVNAPAAMAPAASMAPMPPAKPEMAMPATPAAPVTPPDAAATPPK